MCPFVLQINASVNRKNALQKKLQVAQCATSERADGKQKGREIIYMRKPKTAVIRARCEETLKSDLDLVAALKHLDSADIIRIACAEFVEKFKSGVITAAAGSSNNGRC